MLVKPKVQWIHLLIVCLSTSLFSHLGWAQSSDPDPLRFKGAIQAFINWDKKNTPPKNANLFVGSSSIRLWPTAQAFPKSTVINRGFGGAELSDVIYFYEQIIKPYKPNKIFLYAGDNDIWSGKSPEQVFEDYKQLVNLIKQDLPDTEIIYISIKGSPSRWKKWPSMQATNKLIHDYNQLRNKLGYIDLAQHLIDEKGQFRDAFMQDGLHLNALGYKLWSSALMHYVHQSVLTFCV